MRKLFHLTLIFGAGLLLPISNSWSESSRCQVFVLKFLKPETAKKEYLKVTSIGVSSPSAGQIVGDDKFYYTSYQAASNTGGFVKNPEFLAQSSADQQVLVQNVIKKVEFVYQRYEDTGILGRKQIDNLRAIDAKLDPKRIHYDSFDTADGDPRFVIRVYDGSEVPLHTNPEFRRVPIKVESPNKLPIEIEYPDLVLKDKYKIEIGRSAKQEDLEDVHLKTMIAFAVNPYLNQYKNELVVYAESLEPRLLGYLKNFGFEIRAGTARPNLPPELKSRIRTDFKLLDKPDSSEDRFILILPQIGDKKWFSSAHDLPNWPYRMVAKDGIKDPGLLDEEAHAKIMRLMIGHPENTEIQSILVQKLMDPDAAIRRHATNELRKIHPEDLGIRLKLAEVLHSKNADARIDALRVLKSSIPWGPGGTPLPPNIQLQIANLLVDDINEVKILAADALRLCRPSDQKILNLLAKSLGDSAPEVREAVLDAFATIIPEDVEIQWQIAQLISDPRQAGVQSAAMQTLKKIRPSEKRILEFLQRLAEEGNPFAQSLLKMER